ncbi:PH domain-containing protein [soil metagenome]
MRYADTLLTEGEVVVLRSRQHWLALVLRARAAMFLFLAGIVMLGLIIYFNVSPGVARDVLSGLAAILLLLGALVFIYRLWHWWAQDYLVTNRRLLKVTGILNKRSGDSSLEKINDAILIQPLLGRMLNYGDLEILTAAELANDRYHMLRAPKEFKKTMLTQKHALETEFMYVRPPSPPLRASDADQRMAPPQPAAPAMAPAPAKASDDEAREVTETLAQLADLRDSGALTPQEYEQKKDELLDRL